MAALPPATTAREESLRALQKLDDKLFELEALRDELDKVIKFLEWGRRVVGNKKPQK